MRIVAVQMLAAVFALFLAQDAPPKPEELASIEGKVVNKLTREPVKFAEIILSASEFAPEILKSAPDGTFSVNALRPGRYAAQVSKNGFTPARRKAGQPPEFLLLEKGSKKTGVILELLPQATVSGRVTDENGEPVAGVMITVESTRGASQMAHPGNTNDRGEYRLFNIEPGRYRIRATPISLGNRFDGRADAKPARVDAAAGPREAPVPVYFPSSATADQAAAVELAAGDERQGVDIQLVKGRVFEVSGKVATPAGWTPAPGLPARATIGSVDLVSTRRLNFSPGSSSALDASGRFSIRNVAPGPYILMAYVQNHRGSARLRIDVAQGDLANLEVQFLPPVALTGTVKTPEGFDAKRLSLVLNPVDAMGNSGQGQVDAKGAFKIENLLPDVMTLRVLGLDLDAYVQSVRYDSQDADADALSIRGGDAQLEIAIARNGGSVEGTVRTADDSAEHEGATLVLWPAEGPLKASRTRVARAGAKGRYQLRGIRPGKYLLAAFDTLPMIAAVGLALPEEESLKAARTIAESVIVEPGARLTRDLKSLIAPE